MIKSMIKLAGLSAVGLAAYLYVNKKDPKEFANEVYLGTKLLVSDVQKTVAAKDNLSHNIAKLQDQLGKSKPVLSNMQQDVDEFQFKTKPHLDLITQRINNITK